MEDPACLLRTRECLASCHRGLSTGSSVLSWPPEKSFLPLSPTTKDDTSHCSFSPFSSFCSIWDPLYSRSQTLSSHGRSRIRFRADFSYWSSKAVVLNGFYGFTLTCSARERYLRCAVYNNFFPYSDIIITFRNLDTPRCVSICIIFQLAL